MEGDACGAREEQAVWLLKQQGRRVVVVGDLNIAKEMRDSCDPGDATEFRSSPSRGWLHTLLRDCALADLLQTIQKSELRVEPVQLRFREFHPTKTGAYTCWNMQTGAKLTNYGSRIDYILVDKELLTTSEDDNSEKKTQQQHSKTPDVIAVMDEEEERRALQTAGQTAGCRFSWCQHDGHDGPFMRGSDHCPVYGWLRVGCGGGPPRLPSDSAARRYPRPQAPPQLCAAWLPEAKRRQENLLSMLGSVSRGDSGATRSQSDGSPRRSQREHGERGGASGESLAWADEQREEEAQWDGDVCEGEGAQRGTPPEERANADTATEEPTTRKRSGAAAGRGGGSPAKAAKKAQMSLTSFFSAPALGVDAVRGGRGAAAALPAPPKEPKMHLVRSVTEDGMGQGKRGSETAAEAWSSILSMKPQASREQGKGAPRRNVSAPSYLSLKEQRAYLSTVDEAPLCLGHKEPAVQRTVLKSGPNQGRKFWVCARPNGHAGHEKARCNFFQWT